MEDNYIIRKNQSAKKVNFTPRNKIFATEDSYVMNNSSGKKSELKKEDINKITCIKNAMEKLEKNSEGKNDHLMRYLKAEINRNKKLDLVREKLKKKDEKLKDFMKVKNKGMKNMENERYKDHQDIFERQKIYKKMESNYDQKVYITKKQQQELNKSFDSNKISMEKTRSKMNELKEQIKEYEKKNNEYRQQITNIFDLKDKEEMKKMLKEKKEKKDKRGDKDNPVNKSSSYLIRKKMNDLEEKFEIEKYRRENALMNNMNNFQDKINTYLEKNEEKEKKIKNTILEEEKKRSEKQKKMNKHLDKVRENIKNNEKLQENKRQKLIEDIEKKDLRDYAIKQEKLRMIEERRKINKQNKEQREALILKMQTLMKKEKNISEGEKNEELLNRLLNEDYNTKKNEDEEEE